MEPLAGLFRAARDLQHFCASSQWDFCFIGGIALQRWGEPRSTQDADLGGLPFEERCVERSSSWQVSPGLVLTTCSAEDLVVHKAFAARDQDWADITNILMRQGPKLNLDQIRMELRPLIALKEEPEIEVRLQKLFDQHLK